MLKVFSEIGPLKSVLIHRPGKEIDDMPPSLMDELLFDDILYADRARMEHDLFTSVLKAFGVKVYDSLDLLFETIQAHPQGKGLIIDAVVKAEDLNDELKDKLLSLDEKELSLALVEGIKCKDMNFNLNNFFELAPLANLLMSRDAQMTLGNGLIISAMKKPARRREAILSQFIFSFHPDLKEKKYTF